jgi:glyoxylate carboligase
MKKVDELIDALAENITDRVKSGRDTGRVSDDTLALARLIEVRTEMASEQRRSENLWNKSQERERS